MTRGWVLFDSISRGRAGAWGRGPERPSRTYNVFDAFLIHHPFQRNLNGSSSHVAPWRSIEKLLYARIFVLAEDQRSGRTGAFVLHKSTRHNPFFSLSLAAGHAPPSFEDPGLPRV
jgi:hypothetical protein